MRLIFGCRKVTAVCLLPQSLNISLRFVQTRGSLQRDIRVLSLLLKNKRDILRAANIRRLFRAAVRQKTDRQLVLTRPRQDAPHRTRANTAVGTAQKPAILNGADDPFDAGNQLAGSVLHLGSYVGHDTSNLAASSLYRI